MANKCSYGHTFFAFRCSKIPTNDENITRECFEKKYKTGRFVRDWPFFKFYDIMCLNVSRAYEKKKKRENSNFEKEKIAQMSLKKSLKMHKNRFY